MPAKLFDLAGRVALVTGGNKGLGRAMARGLAEAGADVVIASRHEDELKAALEAILAGTGRRGAYRATDVSVRDDVKKLAQFALEKMGRVDILVNNAGMNAPQAIDAITDETWDRVLEVNLSSVMALTREALLAQHAEARRRRNAAPLGSPEWEAASHEVGRIEIEIARTERAMDPPRV